MSIIEASSKFKEQTKGLSYNKLIEIYSIIDNYRLREDVFAIKDLISINPFDEIVRIKTDTELGFFNPDEIKIFYEKIRTLDHILNYSSEISILDYTVFDPIPETELKYLKKSVHSLKSSLDAVSSDLSDDEISEMLLNLKVPSKPVISSFVEHYTKFIFNLKSKYPPDPEEEIFLLKSFAADLSRSASTERFIEHIFENSFCEVPIELVESFLQEGDIQWGGLWNSSNVDYMHFEIKKSQVSKYLQ